MELGNGDELNDAANTADETAASSKLRFVFPSHDHCFLHCGSLISFLRKYRVNNIQGEIYLDSGAIAEKAQVIFSNEKFN